MKGEREEIEEGDREEKRWREGERVRERERREGERGGERREEEREWWRRAMGWNMYARGQQ